jgi:hypothetical protein
VAALDLKSNPQVRRGKMKSNHLGTVLAVVMGVSMFSLSAKAEAPNEGICAVQQAVACGAFEACERALPAAVNLPALVRFNVKTATIESKRETGGIRTSKIGSSSTEGDSLVLQGVDEGRPWALRVSTKTGQFTLSVLGDDEGYIGFGVCSAKILE